MACLDEMHSQKDRPTLKPKTLLASLGKSRCDVTCVEQMKPSLDLEAQKFSDDKQPLLNAMREIIQSSQDTPASQYQTVLNKIISLRDPALLSSYHMRLLIQHVFTREHNFPREVLLEFIKSGLINMRLFPDFIEKLLERKETLLIHEAVSSIPDMPESPVIQILKYYLSGETDCSNLICTTDDVVNNNVDDSENAEQTLRRPKRAPVEPGKIVALDHLLCLKFDEAMLVKNLRSLQTDEVIHFLKYLIWKMSNCPLETEKTGIPTLQQICSWSSAVLDSNFSRLAMKPEVHPLLLQMRGHIANQLAFFKGLKGLEAMMYQLRDQCILNQDTFVGLYCIEILHIE